MSKRAFKVRTAIVALVCLMLLSVSCSSEQAEDQAQQEPTSQARTEEARPSSETTPSEPRGSLVPITHLTSSRAEVSVEELSQAQELAVPQEFQEVAGELLGRSDLGGSGSVEAVVDRVSRDPESLGLVPWEEVGPRVKALAVNGESLLDPGAEDPEAYPLRPENATFPDAGELRRVVVGGDIVLDRGQNYTVIQQGMGLDFPLDGGYAAVTGRTAEESTASEFGLIHQFTAERRGRPAR